MRFQNNFRQVAGASACLRHAHIFLTAGKTLEVQSSTKMDSDNLNSFIQNERAKCLVGNVRKVMQLCNLNVLINIFIHAELDTVEVYFSKCN